MTKNKIVKYAANTALLAVLAAAGIGVYQLGTAPSRDESIKEEAEFQPVELEGDTEEPMVDAGASQVEADMENALEGDLAGTGVMESEAEEPDSGEIDVSIEEASEAGYDGTKTSETGSDLTADASEVTDVSAIAASIPELSFSEDTLMDWPVNGNILLDYNMEQTTYFPTLDQYKLSPAIAVQAVEGAPVIASVPGSVYSIEENAQTGTTVTMEIGDGYQAIYGQLTDLTVAEGDTVEQGATIGYIAAPTKYYSKEGSNLYFAMKKDGEPVDPIMYLP
ncbi:MAG TPA: M23 family metallopeptidase [Candidatus Blautia faecipullorum]|nr:M23 family metallopeptidase [Candidatus Blautia faecipullorum]